MLHHRFYLCLSSLCLSSFKSCHANIFDCINKLSRKLELKQKMLRIQMN